MVTNCDCLSCTELSGLWRIYITEFRACSSELKFQRQLNRARAADLVQGIEAAALPATAQGVGQHLRRLTELRRTQVIYGAAEIRVVEDIEEIGPRLKEKLLGKRKPSTQS